MIDNPGRRDLLLAGSSVVLAAGTLAPLHAAAQTAAGPATGPAPARELRILLLNPNSSPDFTRIIAAEARRVGSPGTEFVEVTSPFGPRYIGSRATVAIAGHAAVDGLVRVLAKDERFDAAILAGFGAQGVPAMREIAPFPVVDMLTASTSAAILLGNRFSVLTGGDRWVPMLKEQLAALGLGDRVASVRAIPLTGAEITKDPERALALLADLSETCVREDGAECVILGGAAVAGLHRRIADRVSVPLLDSVATSVATAELLARVATTPTASRTRPPAIDSVGLSDDLTVLLKQP
jgi:allantoin racemase